MESQIETHVRASVHTCNLLEVAPQESVATSLEGLEGDALAIQHVVCAIKEATLAVLCHLVQVDVLKHVAAEQELLERLKIDRLGRLFGLKAVLCQLVLREESLEAIGAKLERAVRFLCRALKIPVYTIEVAFSVAEHQVIPEQLVQFRSRRRLLMQINWLFSRSPDEFNDIDRSSHLRLQPRNREEQLLRDFFW